MWELIDGFWVANKYRILYQPKDNDGSALSYATRTMVIEGFTRNFYEAMIKCIHEGQVRLQMMYHELRDLRKQFTCSDASRCTPADSRTKRSSLGYTRNKDLTSILKNKANDQTDTQEKQ
nr:hypothetical protein [Babesia bovis]BAN65581.1 hypothetical protein [Babesia bovis]